MKKIFAVVCTVFLLIFSVFAKGSVSKVANGYGGVTLGMTMSEAKKALKGNMDFGYHGDRDVSLLPGENRALIETDAGRSGYSYLERCWFQFYEDNLYIITINLNKDKIDHYSIFSTLCKKYGDPVRLNPEKSTWTDGHITMTLERPLTLKYLDEDTFKKLQSQSNVDLSGSEITREMFLEGL